MKILISCLSFNSYTGSELYVYELARELAREHDVDIISGNVGGDLVDRVSVSGVKCYDIKSPPNYFLGDGQKQYIINGEIKTTVKGNYYKLSNDTKYDLMLLSHPAISQLILDLYDAPALNIVHSEVLPKFEYPLKHKNVKGYITVRQSIKDYLIDQCGIEDNKIKVVFNPVDTERFNDQNTSDKGYVLFVGSYDYLRKKSIEHLIDRAEQLGKELWLVGRGYPDFQKSWVKTFEPTWDVENFTKKCSSVASVMWGRTVIEGNLCRKSAIVYDVDEQGNIVNIHNLPYMPILGVNPKNVVKEILSFAYEKNISNIRYN